jgi:hypothetical protein
VASCSCSGMTSNPALVAIAATRESAVRRCPFGNSACSGEPNWATAPRPARGPGGARHMRPPLRRTMSREVAVRPVPRGYPICAAVGAATLDLRRRSAPAEQPARPQVPRCTFMLSAASAPWAGRRFFISSGRARLARADNLGNRQDSRPFAYGGNGKVTEILIGPIRPLLAAVVWS